MAHFVEYELQDDMCGFHGFLRMTSAEFNYVLTAISPCIQRADTVMRDAVSPKEMLVLTLRYLASGKYLSERHKLTVKPWFHDKIKLPVF